MPATSVAANVSTHIPVSIWYAFGYTDLLTKHNVAGQEARLNQRTGSSADCHQSPQHSADTLSGSVFAHSSSLVMALSGASPPLKTSLFELAASERRTAADVAKGLQTKIGQLERDNAKLQRKVSTLKLDLNETEKMLETHRQRQATSAPVAGTKGDGDLKNVAVVKEQDAKTFAHFMEALQRGK